MRPKAKYRRRSSRQPVSDATDSVYYAALDANNEMYQSSFSPEWCYIDPWDLENYDYVRRQLSSPPRTCTPSPAGEPIASDFFYLPNNVDECPACYAGMDEQTFYNAKYESILDDDQIYNSNTDIEGSSGGEKSSSYSDGSVSTLLLHTPGFGAASGKRRMVVPKPAPRLEFPDPPPYDYRLTMPESNYCSLADCYECCLMDSSMPLYSPSSIYGGTSSMYNYTNRFGLSKKGLLQIDYSCNWNDLYRYIGKNI